MKPYFTTPITSLAEAGAFFTQLAADGLLFHPEDDPVTVVGSWSGPLFNADEVIALRERIEEVYTFDPDPCAFCNTLDGMNAAPGADVVEITTGYCQLETPAASVANQLDMGTCPCGLCGKTTTMTGTKRCDGCWELESAIKGSPEIAMKVLKDLTIPESTEASPIYWQLRTHFIDRRKGWDRWHWLGVEHDLELLQQLAKEKPESYQLRAFGLI